MSFACLVTSTLLDLDEVTDRLGTSGGGGKSTPQVENDIFSFTSDPQTELSKHTDKSHWFFVAIIAGFGSNQECMQFVEEWKIGRKMIRKLIRGLTLAIQKNSAVGGTGANGKTKLAVHFPHYSIDSVQRLLLASNPIRHGV